MDSAMDHQNDQGRSTSPVSDTSKSNTHPSDSDDASRDSKLRPAIEDGDIIADPVLNNVIEQDTSPKVITSSNNDEPTSSLMDAQPNSADEDWGHIPALIPQPLKTGEQTTQAQEQHTNDMPINLVEASEPESHPAPNAFSDKDLESTENFTNDRAEDVPETQPVQAPSAAQLGTSSQNEEFTSDIPHTTHEVPQNRTEDQILAELRLRLRLPQEQKVLGREFLRSALEGAEKFGSPEHTSVAEDADKIDVWEATPDEDSPLEVSKDEDALVAGLQNLRIETSGSGAVLQEAAASPITTKKESNNDLMNEHDGTLQDDGKEASTLESATSEIFVVGEADDAEEFRPQHHPEDIEAIAVAKDDSKEYLQPPADDNDSALKTSKAEEKADAQDILALAPEQIQTTAAANDDGKEYHQSPTEENPSSKNVGVGEGDAAEESRPQHHAEDIEATAVAKHGTEEHLHSPADNNPSSETSNDKADLDTQNPLPQHHPEDTEAAAATNDDSKQHHQSTIHAPPPKTSEAGTNKKPPLEHHPEDSEEAPKSLKDEVDQSDEPSPTQGIAYPSTMTKETQPTTANEAEPYDITKAQEISQKTEQVSPAETPGKKTGWMEKLRRLRFFAG
ncbi:MAG: hypothetical protein Q9195_007538 [Heterodermia aff. obscurata]